MSLGLPAHLALRVVTGGVSRAGHALAALMLISAVTGALLLSGRDRPENILLICVVCAAVAVSLFFSMRSPSGISAMVYVAVGAVGIAVVTAGGWYMPARFADVEAYIISAIWVALVLVGAAGGSYRRAVLLTSTGLLAGAVGIATGGLLVGGVQRVDPIAPFAAALVIVIYTVTGTSSRRARRAQSDIHRAARDEKLAEVRLSVEARAAALLHDTVLGSLAAVSTTPVGPLPDKMVASLESDLHAIVGQDWSEQASVGDPEGLTGPVPEAVEQAASLGLKISTTGDLSALTRVEPQVAESLALAVRQLLVNVRVHSGTPNAEVVVFGDETTTSVMVIDSGDGFDPDSVSSDRLGLRNSVKRRLDLVDGAVKIWSTPGRGTSVLLSVPVAKSPDGPDRRSARATQGAR